jgi:epoxide hydrolase-like predicted phosphatase
MIKGIIFDFGGPIVKNHSWQSVLDEYDKYYGFESGTVHSTMNKYFKAAHNGDCTTVDDFFEKFNLDLPLDANQLNQILKEAEMNMVVDQNMVKLIKDYKNNYQTALLSNFTTNLNDFLEQFEINNLFDVIVNSSVIKIAKPSPQAYWHTLDEMKLEPQETIFIDDLSKNIEAAEEVGIQGILYENFEQTKSDLEKLIDKNL